MAIVEYASIFLLQGTAADKATVTAIPGARFYETDTGNMFIGTTAGWIATGGGGFTPSVFCAYDSAGATTIDGTTRTVPLGSTRVSDAAYSLSGGEVAISVGGLYRITADFGWEETDLSGGQRASVHCWLERDPLGAGSWATIAGSESGNYARESTDRFSASITILVAVTATDKIRMRVQRTNGTMTLNTLANNSRLNIEFIR